MAKKQEVLRLPAEQMYKKEIDALIKAEKENVPEGWQMSPKSDRKSVV